MRTFTLSLALFSSAFAFASEGIFLITPDAKGKMWRPPAGHQSEITARKKVTTLLKRSPLNQWMPMISRMTIDDFVHKIDDVYLDDMDLGNEQILAALTAQQTAAGVIYEGLQGALLLTDPANESLCIVKADNNEHPLDLVEFLCKEAHKSHGMMVLTLTHTSAQLSDVEKDARLNFADDLANYGVSLPLTSTHGMWAMERHVAVDVQKDVAEAFRSFSEDLRPRWGYDLALILTARSKGYAIKVVEHPATEPRNNTRGKLERQRVDRVLWMRKLMPQPEEVRMPLRMFQTKPVTDLMRSMMAG